MKPVKSAAVQPLVELGVGVGGMMMPPAGWIAASAVPLLVPGFQSVVSDEVVRASGRPRSTSGVPTKEEYVNVYGWSVTL